MHPFRHFCTITTHRHKVIGLCFRAGIGFQGLFHDLSKYSFTEFWQGAKYYQGNRSPNDLAREVHGYAAAWLHHKGRNRHHFEYWCEFDGKTETYRPIQMPMRFVKEMFCDKVAASKTYMKKDYTDDYPLSYYMRGKSRAQMHPKTVKLIESWLQMLANEGETATFTHIKSIPNDQAY